MQRVPDHSAKGPDFILHMDRGLLMGASSWGYLQVQS